MRKHIVRGLVVVSALTVLAGGGPPSAVGKHVNGLGGHAGGHHCSTNPHRHSQAFYKNQAEQQGISVGKARQQHKHHHHKCKSLYPPS